MGRSEKAFDVKPDSEAGEAGEEIILVAASARFLAEAAAGAGYAAITIDAFTDDDTRRVARACERVALRPEGLDIAETRAALSRYDGTPIVVGPGLDGAAARLAEVARSRDFYGNTPEVFRLCADAERFAACLDELEIARPSASRDAAAGLSVTKTPSASGGAHVRIVGAPQNDTAPQSGSSQASQQAQREASAVAREEARQTLGGSHEALRQAQREASGGALRETSREDVRQASAGSREASHEEAKQSRQRYIAGTAVSHLFVAAKGDARSIGFNTLWPSTHASDFSYGGAINRAALSDAQRVQIVRATERLTRRLDLRGINSLDFVVCGERAFCLELNPRPSATMQLYEPDAPGVLFRAHLEACRGALPSPSEFESLKACMRPRAHAVVYALAATTAQPELRNIAGLRDVSIGQEVAAGAPLCSVVVAGERDELPAQVLFRLQSNIRQIQQIQAVPYRKNPSNRR